MQRSLLAALVAFTLGACSSEDGTTVLPLSDSSANTQISNDAAPNTDAQADSAATGDASVSANQQTNSQGSTTDTAPADDDKDALNSSVAEDESFNDDKYDDQSSSTSNGSTDEVFNDDKNDDQASSNGAASSDTQNTAQISDDAASATSDGGQNSNQISDDAASATSDGGQSSNQISDDAASATSDGGQSNNQISDDAASATSDGGQISDDAASATSDGGQDNGDADQQPVRVIDGGNFSSDNTGGSVLRTSSLSSGGSANICTSADAQNNFSDTRVGDFILHNNAWRPWRVFPGYDWQQCIYTNTNGALAGWNYDWGPGQTGINGNPRASGDFYVRSYPELIYGVKDEFRTSAPKSVTGLPVKLSDMPNISIDYSFDGPQYGTARTVDASNNGRFPNGSTISGERNVAIESFLYNPDSSGNCSEGIVTRNGGSNHTYEVMVWLDAGAERLPAGPGDFVTNVTIRGELFKVYTKGSDNRYVAFVAQNPQSSGTIYWNDFTDWARTYAHRVQQEFGASSNSVQIQDSWCVANIIVGTEIFWGAGNFDLYNWTITQSR